MEQKKYGIWGVRSAASFFGEAQTWCKTQGERMEFPSYEEADRVAKELDEHTSDNVHYYAKEIGIEEEQAVKVPPIGL